MLKERDRDGLLALDLCKVELGPPFNWNIEMRVRVHESSFGVLLEVRGYSLEVLRVQGKTLKILYLLVGWMAGLSNLDLVIEESKKGGCLVHNSDELHNCGQPCQKVDIMGPRGSLNFLGKVVQSLFLLRTKVSMNCKPRSKSPTSTGVLK